jgi:hypothetical protein
LWDECGTGRAGDVCAEAKTAMTLIYQSPALANVVFEAVTSGVSAATTSYQVAVAYVTREGAKTLVEALADRARTTWETIPKTIVTCFDFRHTEPGALEYLQANGFEVRERSSARALVPGIGASVPTTSRHACATWVIRARVPLAEAARRLGHSVETLVSTYIGAMDGDDTEANALVDEALAATRTRIVVRAEARSSKGTAAGG